MAMMPLKPIVGFIATALCLTLTACGGSDGSSTSTSTTSSSSSGSGTSSSGSSSGSSSSGSNSSSSGSTPTNVQIALQGTSAPNNATMFSCSIISALCPILSSTYTLYYGNDQSPNLNEVGWLSVSDATEYAIYRSTNGGAYTQIATVSASTASSNYSSYVSNQGSYVPLTNIDSVYVDSSATNVVSALEYPPVNLTGSVTSGSNVFTVSVVNNNTSVNAPGTVTAGQGISGPGIPPNTRIAAFGTDGTTGTGGTGTYALSQTATTTESGQTYGTQYFSNNSYTYYVEAEVGGVWSSPSAYATLPYVVDGQYVLSGGVFGGPATVSAAPATTPLGYSNALEWTANSANSVIGIYAGNSAADEALNVGGYAYLNAAFYTTSSGVTLAVATEVPGDNVIFPMTELSTLGFGSLTPNVWTTYKIPMSEIYVDKQWSGSLIQQNSLYKLVFSYDYGTVPSSNIYVEMWFSVN